MRDTQLTHKEHMYVHQRMVSVQTSLRKTLVIDSIKVKGWEGGLGPDPSSSSPSTCALTFFFFLRAREGNFFPETEIRFEPASNDPSPLPPSF
jgi:hypothetical protein